MKKLTKITALALALALVLGMTAFAGTIIMTDDFSDALVDGALSGTTYKANRTSTYFTPNSAYTTTIAYNTKYYSNFKSIDYFGDDIVVYNPYIAGNDLYQNNRQITFTLPSAWTYDETKALVSHIKWYPIQVADSKVTSDASFWAGSGPAGALMTIGGDTNADYAYDTMQANWNVATQDFRVWGRTHSTHIVNSKFYPNAAKGEPYDVIMVVRPYNHLDESVTTAADSSLDIVGAYGRSWMRVATDDSVSGHFHTSGKDPITAVHGFYYRMPNYLASGWADFKAYTVSLNPADFSITSGANQTDVSINNKVEVVFSQPLSVSTGYADETSSGNGGKLLKLITITPAGGDALVYGEDYDLAVDEVINGTDIKGKLTITPKTNWAFGTTYTVALPADIKNIARVTMAEANNVPVTFTTEAAPTFAMTLNAYEGLSAGTSATAIADGTMYFEAEAVRAAGTATNGTLKIAVYEGDTIVKYATAKKAFASIGDSATLKAAFKVKAGQTVKAFVDGALGEAAID